MLIILAAVFTGCTQKGEVEEKQQITVTDLLGREVTLNYPVQKVVLSFNFEEYLAVAGYDALKMIAGWSRGYWEGRRQDTWEQFTSTYPELKDIPDIGYASQGTFNAEKVIALKPDVVIMYRDPFARQVQKVTALEPAKEMIEIMKRNAREKGVENFDIINKVWQEAEISEMADKYDLVISSLVSWMFEDIWAQLTRMEQASKGYCCIVTGAGEKNGDEEKLWRDVMGEVEQPSYQEYPLIYNLLYAKGRYPNVQIIRYAGERSVESTIRYRTLLYAKYLEMTPAIEEKIREHVLTQAVQGQCRRESVSAVIWWKAKEARLETRRKWRM